MEQFVPKAGERKSLIPPADAGVAPASAVPAATAMSPDDASALDVFTVEERTLPRIGYRPCFTAGKLSR
ncbi:hypothetical protein ACIQVA_40020 [Streptomyces microflavus]|uniref:hypothetical protein n=1 Tax=Streptomyces microflavus TaxID=1919 RepID=UPI00381CCD5B